MKEDEIWLLKRIYEEHLKKTDSEFTCNVITALFRPLSYKVPRQIIEEQDRYNHKRLWYVLDKFSSKGIVNYGVSLGSAWLEDKGIELARGLEEDK